MVAFAKLKAAARKPIDYLFFSHKAEDYASKQTKLLREFYMVSPSLSNREDYPGYENSKEAQNLYKYYEKELAKVRKKKRRSEYKSMGRGALAAFAILNGGRKVVEYLTTGSVDNIFDIYDYELMATAATPLLNGYRNRSTAWKLLREGKEMQGKLSNPFVSNISKSELQRLANKTLGANFDVYEKTCVEYNEKYYNWRRFNSKLLIAMGTFISVVGIAGGEPELLGGGVLIGGAGGYLHRKDRKQINKLRAKIGRPPKRTFRQFMRDAWVYAKEESGT